MPIAAWIRKGVLLKLLAAAFLCFFLSPQLVFAASVRIMPLGDSITYDNHKDDTRSAGLRTGYRQPLWLLLQDAGYDVDFVGSVMAGQDATPTFDPDNEGHPGWQDADIAANISDWLQNTPADVILLHIGTNGLDTNPNDVKNILDQIDSYSKNIWVVLVRIINRQDYVCSNPSTTTTFNNNVEAMALDRVNNPANPAYPDKIIVVDMECGAGLDYRQDQTSPYVYDMYDTLHPNDSGYAKMADKWFQGLLEILPVAYAGGDQNVNPGNDVTLDGGGSTDAPGTIVSYAWVQTGGSPAVTLANANTAQARFTAPDTSTGTALTFKLSITDDKGFTHSDSCVVNVNGRPTPDAGPDQQVNPGASVVLDGSNSNDADGSIVAYQWLQTAGIPIVALANAGTVRASFSSPSVGGSGTTLTFKLTVTDDKGATRSDICVVNVNGPPVAAAGTDQQVQSGASVTLDGSGSTDGGDGAIAYAWVQTSGPAVALSNPSSVRPSFRAPTAGAAGATLTFQLIVTDNGGLQSEDSCTVTVSPQEGGASGSSGGGGGGGCFITAAGQ